jgi:hypothetical protein
MTIFDLAVMSIGACEAERGSCLPFVVDQCACSAGTKSPPTGDVDGHSDSFEIKRVDRSDPGS